MFEHTCATTQKNAKSHVFKFLKKKRTYGFRGRLCSRVVNVLDSGAERPMFKSQSRRCRITVLGKLFTSSKIGSSPLKGCGGNCRPGGK